jgi:predicted nucleic-acid-binding Zn-ribbon protein
MKSGTCLMCKSNEVYMTEKNNNLDVGDAAGLSFSAGEQGRAPNYFFFDTYVCLNCGYTAMFARDAFPGGPGLSFLKIAKGWKKVG